MQLMLRLYLFSFSHWLLLNFTKNINIFGKFGNTFFLSLRNRFHQTFSNIQVCNDNGSNLCGFVQKHIHIHTDEWKIFTLGPWSYCRMCFSRPKERFHKRKLDGSGTQSINNNYAVKEYCYKECQ